MIWDDEHIAWWERGRRNQMVNMEENPRAAVVFRNHELNVGWRFYGEVTFHPQGDPLWEQVWERWCRQSRSEIRTEGDDARYRARHDAGYPGEGLERN